MSVLTETEVKLRLPGSLLVDLAGLDVFDRRCIGGWTRVLLCNQYFDTPDLALDRAGFALRLRRDGDQVIQTFKGRGDSMAGFSVRAEWDWYLDREQLDLERLQEAELPTRLTAGTLQRVVPLFRTDFERTKGTLSWARQGEPVEVEVALDIGEARAGEQVAPIRELELELRQGPREALLEFAQEVAQEVAVMPWDSAKAERGYRLLDPGRRPEPPLLEDSVFEKTETESLVAAVRYLLAKALTAVELLSLGDPRALQQIRSALGWLDVAGDIACKSGAPFPVHAAEQNLRLQNILAGIDSSLADGEQAQVAFAVLEHKRDWGLLTLGLSHWLWQAQGDEFGRPEQDRASGKSETGLLELLRECVDGN